MLSAIHFFGRLIAQGLLTEAEVLPHIVATDPVEAPWDLGYAVEEWMARRGAAAVAIIEEVTAMQPCGKAAAYAYASRINGIEFESPLRDAEVRKLCRAVWIEQSERRRAA